MIHSMNRTLRIGHGFDTHRLEPLDAQGPIPTRARPLVLGGVPIEHDRGPVAHSDGDALLHAITDAILGAIAGPDIGELFPNDDPANQSRDSADFVRAAAARARDAGLAILNLDCTVILEKPRLSPHKDAIRASVASLLGVDPSCVGIKGKTGEGVDAVGRGDAVHAHAVVLLAPVE